VIVCLFLIIDVQLVGFDTVCFPPLSLQELVHFRSVARSTMSGELCFPAKGCQYVRPSFESEIILFVLLKALKLACLF
jgi:hypothetical protein